MNRKLLELVLWLVLLLPGALFGAYLFDRTEWVLLFGALNGVVTMLIHGALVKRLHKRARVTTPTRHDLSLRRRPK